MSLEIMPDLLPDLGTSLDANQRRANYREMSKAAYYDENRISVGCGQAEC